MPYMKAISGHFGLAGARRYLERSGRALAHDYLGFDAHVIANDALLSLRYAVRPPTVAPCPARAARNVPQAPFVRHGLSPGRSLLLPWVASGSAPAHKPTSRLRACKIWIRTDKPSSLRFVRTNHLALAHARGRTRREIDSLPSKRRRANPPVADWPREPASTCGATARDRHRPRPARRCGRAASSA